MLGTSHGNSFNLAAYTEQSILIATEIIISLLFWNIHSQVYISFPICCTGVYIKARV